MLFKRIIRSSALVLALATTFVSCGKSSQIVKGLNVQTTTNDQGEINIRVSSDIDFGNIMFPTLQIPINHGGQTIGSVSMIPVLGSKTQLVVEYNVGSLGSIAPGPVALPNGTLAPLIGTNAGVTVNLGGGAKLYVVAGAGVYALGVAIPISGLDSVGSALGGINFFPMFNIDKAVGAAGIFASKTPGKTGFAFFVDASQYMNGLDFGLPAAQTETLALSRVMMQQEVEEVELDYNEQRPSSKVEKKLNSLLYDMHRRKVRLAR